MLNKNEFFQRLNITRHIESPWQSCLPFISSRKSHCCAQSILSEEMSNVGRSKSLSSSPPPLVSLISIDEVFSSQDCVSVSNPFRRTPAHALKGCDKEDESDVTFTAFCLPTLLCWSACLFESSKCAARQGKLNQGFFSSILLRNYQVLVQREAASFCTQRLVHGQAIERK